jgi:hypothetical protein
MDNELIKVCIGSIIIALWVYNNIYYDGFKGLINSVFIILLILGISYNKDNIKSIDTRLKQIEELIYDNNSEETRIEISYL